jgi:hypothetical protein
MKPHRWIGAALLLAATVLPTQPAVTAADGVHPDVTAIEYGLAPAGTNWEGVAPDASMVEYGIPTNM